MVTLSNTLLPAGPVLGAFLAASVVLAVTPGPGVLYILTRSISQGRKAGLASVLGVATGNLGNALAASLGLAAIFAVSSTAFLAVKYAGALYLVYLGISTFLSSPAERATPDRIPVRAGKIYRDGVLVSLLNPKTTIFFAAFLPQFLGAAASNASQTIALGVLFVMIACVTDSLYAVLGGALAPVLTGGRKVYSAGRYLSGGIYIGLGVLTACSSTKSSR